MPNDLVKIYTNFFSLIIFMNIYCRKTLMTMKKKMKILK